MASHVTKIGAAALQAPVERLLPEGGNANEVPTKQAGGGVAWAAQQGGGASAFTDLTDVTFANYSGRAGQYLRVNSGATGLESVAASQTGTDASVSNYTQAGTGAVTRTVKTKLDEVLSVKDFGALGNGSADDTAAIQAALDRGAAIATGNATGATVFFPPGRYMISTTLLNNGFVSMEGASPRAVRIAALAGFPATMADPHPLHGGETFDRPQLLVEGRGVNDAHIRIGNFMFDGQGNAPSGLHTVQGSNLFIYNIRTASHPMDGIVIDAMQNSTLLNCRPGTSTRYNWHILNGAAFCEFFGCNGRLADGANLAMRTDALFPGFGVANQNYVRDCNWYGHILEDDVTDGAKGYVIDLQNARRVAFYGMNLVAPVTQAVVRVASGSDMILLSRCFFNGGGAPVNKPAVSVAGTKVRVVECWFENYNSTGNILECSSVDGLSVSRCFFAGNIAFAGKLIANTSATPADTRVIEYTPLRASGTTAERPSMAGIDATAQYWDRSLAKPVWWDPNDATPKWKDAIGNPA